MRPNKGVFCMEFIKKEVTFKNGSKHLEVRVKNPDGSPGRFVKFEGRPLDLNEIFIFQMPWGQYKDLTFGEIFFKDFKYLVWLSKQKIISKSISRRIAFLMENQRAFSQIKGVNNEQK